MKSAAVKIVLIAFLALPHFTNAADPAQFAGLKKCVRTGNYGSQVLTGDCAAYDSPNDPIPPVYDGTNNTVYTDPIFGTKIKRITTQPGMEAGSYVPKYAPTQAWSKDGNYMILGGPHGNIYLMNGNSPYNYIRKLNIANEGVDELWYNWSNVDDKYLWNTYGRTIRKYDVTDASDTPVMTYSYTTLTDIDGNTLDLVANNLTIKPYMYAGISDNDMRLASKIVDGGGRPYGFAVFNLSDGSVQMFHKITSPGSLEQNGAPINKMPGAATISPDGDKVIVQWSSDNYQITFSSIARSNNVVTMTSTTTLPAGYVTGSTISVLATYYTASPITNLNTFFGTTPDVNPLYFSQKFANITRVDNNTITFASTGADGSYSKPGDMTIHGYYKYFGTDIFNMSGTFVKHISDTDSHADTMRFTDGSQAFLGGAGSYSDEVTSLAYRGAGAFNLNTYAKVGCFQTDDSYSSNRQAHFSGRGAQTGGLLGYGLISTYYEGNNVDTSPQIPFMAEIFACKMDGSNTMYRIAHAQSAKGNEYYGEPHATPNRDFTKILFGSTWRVSGDIAGSVQAYVVELPSGAPDTTAPAAPSGLSVQ